MHRNVDPKEYLGTCTGGADYLQLITAGQDLAKNSLYFDSKMFVKCILYASIISNSPLIAVDLGVVLNRT
jgi:hypothetical protein